MGRKKISERPLPAFVGLEPKTVRVLAPTPLLSGGWEARPARNDWFGWLGVSATIEKAWDF